MILSAFTLDSQVSLICVVINPANGIYGYIWLELARYHFGWVLTINDPEDVKVGQSAHQSLSCVVSLLTVLTVQHSNFSWTLRSSRENTDSYSAS